MIAKNAFQIFSMGFNCLKADHFAKYEERNSTKNDYFKILESLQQFELV